LSCQWMFLWGWGNAPHVPAALGTLCCCTQPHPPSYHWLCTRKSQTDIGGSQIRYKQSPL